MTTNTSSFRLLGEMLQQTTNKPPHYMGPTCKIMIYYFFFPFSPSRLLCRRAFIFFAAGAGGSDRRGLSPNRGPPRHQLRPWPQPRPNLPLRLHLTHLGVVLVGAPSHHTHRQAPRLVAAPTTTTFAPTAIPVAVYRVHSPACPGQLRASPWPRPRLRRPLLPLHPRPCLLLLWI